MTLRVFKWVGITVCVLLCLLITAYVIIYFRVNARITKKYDVTLEKINVMYDSAAIARGSRIVGIRACKECHGEDLSGRVMADDNVIGRFVTANLTRGKGGLRPDFTEEDWVLAMKHGLRRDGSPLLLMPSHELSHMSEEDMSSIIAYCSTLPAVDNELPPSKLGPLAYVLTEFNQIPLLPAEMTDHSKPLVDAIKPEASVAYGKYLAVTCVNCHGENYKGGKSPVPGGKDRPDITSAGNPGKWTLHEFMHVLRTGETPDGRNLNQEEMPWAITKSYNDTELEALHLYLKSLK